MFFHVFGHVEPDQSVFIIKKKFRQGLCQLCFSHPGRAKQEEGPDGFVFFLKARSVSSNGVTNSYDSIILPNDPLMQVGFHVSQFVLLGFLNFIDRNSRPVCHHSSDIFGGDIVVHSGESLFPVATFLFKFFINGKNFLPKGGNSLKILLLEFFLLL